MNEKKKHIRDLNIKRVKFDWKHTDLELGMKYNKKNLQVIYQKE